MAREVKSNLMEAKEARGARIYVLTHTLFLSARAAAGACGAWRLGVK